MNSFSCKPYEGFGKYITVINCREDSERIQSILKKPMLDGLRVWFDESREENENTEKVLSEKIKNCCACFLFVSNNAFNSHCVRSAVNNAVFSGKPVVAIFIEQTDLTLGIEMQIKTMQVIDEYKLTRNAFLQEISENKYVRSCSETKAKPITMWLERVKTKQIFILKNGATTFGRLPEMCDVAIEDNRYIGRMHATVIHMENRCFVIDNSSKNKSFVNSKMLVPEKQIEIHNNDVVTFADEEFVFHCE